jgi:hypothetical protein
MLHQEVYEFYILCGFREIVYKKGSVVLGREAPVRFPSTLASLITREDLQKLRLTAVTEVIWDKKEQI